MSSAGAPSPIPPLVRTIDVAWPPETAFWRFTQDFGTWWPIRTHSVGGARTRTAVFEGHVGGSIYEEFHDGGRSVWGTVLVWEPPRRVVFTWHPSRPPETAGEVEIRFERSDKSSTYPRFADARIAATTPPDDGPVFGTRVVLTHSRWERFGDRARRMRRGYGLGWRYVLDTWAGRRTLTVRGLDAISAVVQLVTRKR